MNIANRVAKVDESKCAGCRTCEHHCPTHAIGVRKTDEHFVPPCTAACPAGIDVRGYIALAAAGRYEDAYRLIRQNNPLPSVCGRICTHPCQLKCNRNDIEKNVAIREIKRFVSDKAWNGESFPMETRQPLNGKTIGIVGAGPSGLACAYYLALSGYQVDIYEAEKEAGGILLYGIPEYRLPKEVLRRDIKAITDIGVNIITNTKVGEDITMEELYKKYRAVYIATGAQFSKKAGIPGEDLKGVYHGLDFLKESSIGGGIEIGKKVVVIGGGSTATDVARTAVRMGAEEVTILYRRRITEMPADVQEILEAKEEGVEIVPLTAPVAFIGADKVEKIRCTKMQTAGYEKRDKRKAVPIEGSEFEIEADTVIVAVSQYFDYPFIDKDEIAVSRGGLIELDENGMTTKSFVFAGGDVVNGPDTVIRAVADGKKAAVRINEFLGMPYDIYSGDEIEVPMKSLDAKINRAALAKINNLPRDERTGNYDEVNQGLTEEQILIECDRCLGCQGTAEVEADKCLDCTLCWELCPHEAIKYDILPEPKYTAMPHDYPIERAQEMIEICNKAFYRPLDQVCQCTATTAEDVVEAIWKGAHNIYDVHFMTGAGGGCGGGYCANMLYRLLDAAGYPQEDPGDDSHHPTLLFLQNMPENAGDHEPRFRFKEIRKAQWNEEFIKNGNNDYLQALEDRRKGIMGRTKTQIDLSTIERN